MSCIIMFNPLNVTTFTVPQSVCYHDPHGFQVAGYVRCSRLIKRATYDDSEPPIVDLGPPSKKSKAAPYQAEQAIVSPNELGLPFFQNGTLQASSRASLNGPSHCHDPVPESKHHIDKSFIEEEYVCVIRPADASFPYVRGNRLFSSLLSTASMVAHDLELRSSGYNNQADPLAAGWSKEDYLAEGRRGLRHSYLSSDAQQCSDSSNGTKNSTSSETNSEDNGESDEHDTPL